MMTCQNYVCAFTVKTITISSTFISQTTSSSTRRGRNYSFVMKVTGGDGTQTNNDDSNVVLTPKVLSSATTSTHPTNSDSIWRKIPWDSLPYNNTNYQQFMRDYKYNLSSDDTETYKTYFSPEAPSPVQLVLIRDRLVYIKRDDLLHLRRSNVSGNKARKMFALNQLDIDQFPTAIISYGGPQSNAMLSLAAIVNAKNIEALALENQTINDFNSSSTNSFNYSDEVTDDSWLSTFDDSSQKGGSVDSVDNDDEDNTEFQLSGKDDDLSVEEMLLESSLIQSSSKNTFTSANTLQSPRLKRFIYYTKKLPRYLRNQPNGNLLRALSLGMELREVSNDDYKRLFGGSDGGSAEAPKEIDPPIPYESLWIPQGGACGVANVGIKVMAMEIVEFWKQKGKNMPLSVVVPGGTCTTAMMLSREINFLCKSSTSTLDIQVAVIPCVGVDAEYANRQMKALDVATGGNGVDDIPHILQPLRKTYLRFGEPSPIILNTFFEMKKEYGVFLDLLYGAPAWSLLLRYLRRDVKSPIQGRQIMYVHSGGLEGISSQMTRYKHKGLLDGDQIQS